MVTTKKSLVFVQISVEISVQFQKIPIANIENFAILATDILPIQYIGAPLLGTINSSCFIITYFSHVATAILNC